jgi:hypothetical protein
MKLGCLARAVRNTSGCVGSMPDWGRRMGKVLITTSFSSVSTVSTFLLFERLSSRLRVIDRRRIRARLTASASRSLPVSYPAAYCLPFDSLSFNPFLLRHSFPPFLNPRPQSLAALSSSVLQVSSRPTTHLHPQTIPRHPRPSAKPNCAPNRPPRSPARPQAI